MTTLSVPSGWSRRTPAPADSKKPTPRFDRLVDLVNEMGLLPEEYDLEASRMAGNVSQPCSNLPLAQAPFAPADAAG